MPELPEVEAARKAVEVHCVGRKVLKANVANDSTVVLDVSPKQLEEALVGRTIRHAHRKGKHLWLELDKHPWPSFQFGMTGAINIRGVQGTKYQRSAVKDDEDWPSKFSKVHLVLDSGVEMAFTDIRRFARVRLLNDPSTVPPIAELGCDSLLEIPSVDKFVESILQKKGAIKGILLDQSFLAGIGNWIADEVLYQSRIHPEQPTASLSRDEGCRLHKAIQAVIGYAVEVNADSDLFPKDWIFHHRWDRKSGAVSGLKIEFITVKGRTSAYVPAVQKYTGPPLKSARKSAINEVIETSQQSPQGKGIDKAPSKSRVKKYTSEALGTGKVTPKGVETIREPNRGSQERKRKGISGGAVGMSKAGQEATLGHVGNSMPSEKVEQDRKRKPASGRGKGLIKTLEQNDEQDFTNMEAQQVEPAPGRRKAVVKTAAENAGQDFTNPEVQQVKHAQKAVEQCSKNVEEPLKAKQGCKVQGAPQGVSIGIVQSTNLKSREKQPKETKVSARVQRSPGIEELSKGPPLKKRKF